MFVFAKPVFRGEQSAAVSSIRMGRPAVVIAALALLGGCQSPLMRSAFKADDAYAEMTSTDKIHGPLGRWFGRTQDQSNAAVFGPPPGQDEFEAAQKLADAGNWAQAEKELKRIVKKYKSSSIHEDALFLLAEARFQQQKYSWAQDSFDELLKEYPSTRYMDRTTRRLFAIARHWLGAPQAASSTGDVQTAGFDESAAARLPTPSTHRDPTLAVPILPNLWDRTRPVFDTHGRALQALKSIWLNDPTGPLADDALMLTAAYHLRKEDYLEADRIFNILREEYPKSPHLQDAFVLGSHVKLMSYQGAAYDGKSLLGAEQLKESALRLFPDTVDKQRLSRELALIEEAKAQKDWEMVLYYLKKNNTRGAVIYCQEVIRNYPRTRFAAEARKKLAELSPGHPLANTPEPEPADGPRAIPVPKSVYE